MKKIYFVVTLVLMTMVSCVPEAEKATVETREVKEVTSNSAKVVCNASDDGGAEITSRGVCWSVDKNPTIETASSMESGSGIGNYECEIGGLHSNTTYYVRAYATNSAGVSYGEGISFKTSGAGGDDDNDDNDFEPDGEISGHGYFDLGLPSGVKWATCNVGATSPEDYGDYFAWGETETKDEYTEENNLTDGLSISELETQGYIDGEGNLTASHDAATAHWGGAWRMPTLDEMRELVNNCTWTWLYQNGVEGYKVTGPNGNSIFLPATGYRNGSSLDYDGDRGGYWSSTPIDYDNDHSAYYLYFLDSGYHGMSLDSNHHYGLSVRPVLE